MWASSGQIFDRRGARYADWLAVCYVLRCCLCGVCVASVSGGVSVLVWKGLWLNLAGLGLGREGVGVSGEGMDRWRPESESEM